MSNRSLYLSAFAAVLRRDAQIYASYRFRAIAQIAALLLSVTLFYYVSKLVGVRRFSSTDEYFAFVVVGLVILEVLTSTLVTLPLTVRQELVAGTFERVATSAFGAVGGIAAMLLFPVAVAVTLGGVTTMAAVVLYGMPIVWSTAVLALPVAILGAFAFAPFALLMAATVLAAKQAGGGASFVVSGIALVSGIFFPIALLPGWLRWMSNVQPFTPALDLMRHLLIGTPLQDSAALNLVKLVGFATLMLPVGVSALNTAVAFCAKRGTLTEY
jgi:ABC-2 type transport system permease protein